MNKWIILQSIPVGSLYVQPAAIKEHYWDIVGSQPARLKEMLSSQKTGAFLRGLIKMYNLPETTVSILAFAVLEVGVGEKQLAQLASILSSKLQLANDKAQQLALEIEKELFVPVMLDLNQLLSQQKKAPSLPPNVAAAGGARNILDLTTQPRPPVPPPIPRK